jgi:uncharacterized membrane protein YdjX (TVP38/TMEM64 family)
MSQHDVPWRLLLLLVIAAVAVPVLVFYPLLAGQLAELIEWLRSLGPSGYLLVVAIYIVAAALLLPSWPLTWSAGFIFGVVPGTIVASLGGTLGAISGFLCGRYLARDWVQKLRVRWPLLQALETAVEENGFKIVALSRLSPAFPYNVINYAYGTTRLPLRTYVGATWLGMFPVTVVHVFLGASIKNVDDLVRGQYEGGLAARLLLGLGIVATLAATIMITRAARRALQAALPAPK